VTQRSYSWPSSPANIDMAPHGLSEANVFAGCGSRWHLDGIANYCRTKVRMGVVEAVKGNIRMLINRGRGYKNLRYLLLKAKRLAVSNLELSNSWPCVESGKQPRNLPTLSDSRSERILLGSEETF
jgi:hypothetical protein